MFRRLILRWRDWQKSRLIFVGILVCTTLLLVSGQIQALLIASAQDTAAAPQPQEQLPALEAHPLPASLSQWQDAQQQGDYFAAIAPTPVGYLVWSRFPVQVWIEPVDLTGSAAVNAAEANRAQAWVAAATEAMQEWSIYLPLEQVNSSEAADITIWRSAPPIQLTRSSAEAADSTPINALPRIRSAETKYHLFVDRPADAPAQLSQRFTIQLTPNQTRDYIKATARHELGHALGIWGHSPVETDALYFSQVRNSPPISDRDINTLKRIYQQPTRVGWEIVSD